MNKNAISFGWIFASLCWLIMCLSVNTSSSSIDFDFFVFLFFGIMSSACSFVSIGMSLKWWGVDGRG